MKSLSKALPGLSGAAGVVAFCLLFIFPLGSAAAKAGPRSAPLEGEGEGLKLVANLEWPGGTDMELATIRGRDYAFAYSRATIAEGGGLHVIDVTKPDEPEEVARLKCVVSQGDIQISHDQKTVMIAADVAAGPEGCMMVGKLGFLTVDISNPKKPKAVGVAEIPRGSHNITAHPTEPYVYNSDSDLANTGLGEIQIWSIKNPKKPELVNTVKIGVHSPHDISFNEEGSLAITASAALIHLLDTSDPENPKILSVSHCPSCSAIHDAKFTLDSAHAIVGDEAGFGTSFPCPGGALHFYNVVNRTALVYTGAYEPEELVIAPSNQSGLGSCTSHVFDISPDGTKIAISWYTAGTRYLDISSMTGITVGSTSTPNSVRELAWFIPVGSSSWSSKFHKGPWIYSNDVNRGFDVYKITPT